jgi:integrase/recombinase XerD
MQITSEEATVSLPQAGGKGLKAKPAISVLPDYRRPLDKKKFPEYAFQKEEVFPVKLWACFQVMKAGAKQWQQDKFQLYYSNGRKVVATRADFDKATGKNTPIQQHLQEIRREWIAAQKKADDICNSVEFMTPENFGFMFSTAGSLQTVKAVFDLVVAEQTVPGTRRNYAAARDTLFAYAPDLTFAEVTPAWIELMLSKLLNRKRKKPTPLSATSKNIYMRTFKLAFKKAIALKLVKADSYPFGEDKFQIMEEETEHEPLSMAEKNLLESWQFTGKERSKGEAKKMRWALDLWLFSFYCSGLNMADIFGLKRSHIFDNEEIRKKRQKNENRANRKLRIPVDLPEVQAIIARQGVLNSHPDAYVFPVYTEGMDEDQKLKTRLSTIGLVNKYVRRVARQVGLTKDLTTYTARHSFAGILYGEIAIPIEEIQVSLGHATKQMTETYLHGMPLKLKKQRQQTLRNLEKAAG